MNTGHYFSIGHTHNVCEDYAMSGIEANTAYAIVCDGCSSSQHVDLGARALAFATRDIVVHQPDLFFSAGMAELGHVIIDKASVIQRLGTEPTCLDATVLVAAFRDGKSRICMWGDGVCVMRWGDQRAMIVHVEYASGAPYYLSYRLTPNRHSAYMVQFDQPKTLVTIFRDKDGNMTTDTVQRSFSDPVEFCEPLHQGNQISLISDGINQFRGPTNDLIEWSTLIDEFTSYKNINGVFVRRRMNFFKRKCEQKQITHDDDISVASLIV